MSSIESLQAFVMVSLVKNSIISMFFAMRGAAFRLGCVLLGELILCPFVKE
jgi:hypothetical protein